MPTNLVYQLALTRAEAVDMTRLWRSLRNRFFRARREASCGRRFFLKSSSCTLKPKPRLENAFDAETFLANEHPGPRAEWGRRSRVSEKWPPSQSAANRPQEAEQLLQKAAASENIADMVWAARAETVTRHYDAAQEQQKAQASLSHAVHVADTSSYTGWWVVQHWSHRACVESQRFCSRVFHQRSVIPDSMMSASFQPRHYG